MDLTSIIRTAGLALALLLPLSSAASDEHRQQDIAKHRQIAEAHAAAARCAQSGGKPADCQAQLQKACKGIAVGPNCGLRSRPGESEDARKQVAEHQTMVTAHGNAAQCLAAGTPYRDCQAALKKDCGGVGVGKYCGMRHAH
jgi:hypothetical protein